MVRDIGRELAARVEAQRASLTRHFRAALPAGVSVAARVALVGTSELDLRELTADPDAFVVVGRHSEASMRAADSASLSLRHVLLIPQPTASGPRVLVDIVPLAPTVRVAPWSYPLPEPLAELCSAFLLGDSLLLLAPISSDEHVRYLRLVPPVAVNLERHSNDQPRPSEPPRWTRISTAYTATDLPPAGLESPAGLVLEVRAGERRVRLDVHEAWLARGILLGRNPEKCSHEALAEALSSDQVSRCHLYLRREQDQIVFYDTASTAGVCVDDELVRRVALPAPLPAAAGAGTASAVNPARVVLSLTDDVFVTLFASDQASV